MEHLVRSAWDIFNQFKHELVVVKPSIPILYFGDSIEYFKSTKRIVTVGLNPSKAEFPPDNPFKRFPEAECLSYNDIASGEEKHSIKYLSALNSYFSTEPYGRWFDSAYKHILAGLDTDFYSDTANTALHTDLCSPLATDPTWSKLNYNARNMLEPSGIKLWHDLIEFLQPDLVLMSVRESYLEDVNFTKVFDWTVAYTVSRSNPYTIKTAQYKTASGKIVIFVFGRAAQLPFGTINRCIQYDIGVYLKDYLESIQGIN
ncbi:MAG: hypothetical protein ACYC27_14515 [Armatimonadota bacterium]